MCVDCGIPVPARSCATTGYGAPHPLLHFEWPAAGFCSAPSRRRALDPMSYVGFLICCMTYCQLTVNLILPAPVNYKAPDTFRRHVCASFRVAHEAVEPAQRIDDRAGAADGYHGASSATRTCSAGSQLPGRWACRGCCSDRLALRAHGRASGRGRQGPGSGRLEAVDGYSSARQGVCRPVRKRGRDSMQSVYGREALTAVEVGG
jgi:hypothetical protein